jgi:hypothetical protein
MSEICLSCGLCCDGTLFQFAALEPDEAPRAERRRLRVHQLGDGTKVVLQPCAAHQGACAIYDERPLTCTRYRCSTLDAVESGAMPEGEARALLDRTKALARSVRESVPGNDALWRDVAHFVEDSPAWRRDHASLLLDIAELQRLVVRIEPMREKGEKRRLP